MNVWIVSSIALMMCLGPARAEMVNGDKIVVIDGDTVALPCILPGRGCAERIRFTDIDAPEIFHPDCDEGLKAGLKAKERLIALIRGKQIWIERSGRTDPYRRTLAALRIGGASGTNAGLELVREELALPYKPGAVAKEDRRIWWCGPP